MYSLRHFFERHGFYVCARLADRLGMRTKNVRIFFVFHSFDTDGVVLLPLALVFSFTLPLRFGCV